MNANQSVEVASPDLLQELGELKVVVNSLKIERDKIVEEQETVKKELEIDLETKAKKEKLLENDIEDLKSEIETKEKKEKVLENDIKDLKSEISKLKKIEQDNHNLVNEVGEVQNKLNLALTD